MNYKKRHDTLVKNIPQKSMFVCTRTDERMKGDGPYFDFTSGDFLYFTGITQPNSILLITTYPKKQTILFIDKPNKKHELWMGAQLTKQQAKKTSQVHVVKYLDEFKETYAAILKTHTLLTYSTHPRNEEKNSTLTSALRVKKKKKNMYTVLMDMRVIKDTQELALIKKAIRITADGFANVSKENLKTESQIMGIFAQSFFSQNATFAYQPICASGKNACVLHYITNDSVIDQQKPILLDVGAEVCGYDADITRTINITTKRQEAIYTAVLAVQEFAISLLKPGVYLKEYEQKVREFMGRQLITLKLIKKATPKAIAELYPHGTGHFLGLDTHDVGDYKKPLAAGMVITVEPGIYSKKEGIGIRIEDNILITKTGCKVLSAMIPK